MGVEMQVMSISAKAIKSKTVRGVAGLSNMMQGKGDRSRPFSNRPENKKNLSADMQSPIKVKLVKLRINPALT